MANQLIKVNQLPAEVKSSPMPTGTNQFSSFVEFLIGQEQHGLSAHVALTYYKKVSPLFDGIDRLTEEISSIQPVLFDKQTEEYIIEHPLLDRLANPNSHQNYGEFMKELATFFIVTGNEYLVTTGNPNREPLELYNEHPATVSIIPSSIDGYAQKYEVSNNTTTDIYLREEKGLSFTYVNPQQTRTLCQLKTMNPTRTLDYLYGMTRLTPIFYEIEQYLHSNIHNLSLLMNGATPSGVLSTDKNLNDEQYTRLVAEMASFFQSAKNAGRPMVAEGGLTYSNMALNNKDMDFLNLKKDVRDSLYNNLRIPLPLISRDQMTLANMESAKFIFYDNAVLPFYDKIMAALAMCLFPRYKLDINRYEITYQEDNIPALAARHFAQTKELASMNALTLNEVRARLGYDEIDGGDQIYQPATLIPLGEEPNEPEAQEAEPVSEEQFKLFKEHLQKKTKEDGSRLYSDEEIKTIAIEEGLLNASHV